MDTSAITAWLSGHDVGNGTHLLLFATTICIMAWLMHALNELKVYKKGTRFLTTELCKSAARERVFASELHEKCGRDAFDDVTKEIQEAGLLPSKECIEIVQKMDVAFSVCGCPDCRKDREVKAKAKAGTREGQHAKT